MLTVGQLAAEAQVPVSTVRYYERRGLLQPEERTRSRYRLYGTDALHRLRFIRAAQESGFTLENIRRLLNLRDGSEDPCEEVQELIAVRLAAIEQDLADLRRFRGVLRETLDLCRRPRAKGCCEAVVRLDREASGN